MFKKDYKMGEMHTKEKKMRDTEVEQRLYYLTMPDLLDTKYVVAFRMKRYENWTTNYIHHMTWWTLPRTTLE